jgi:hypothetical protein
MRLVRQTTRVPRRLFAALASLAAILVGCSSALGVTEPKPGALRILFIGNSLTYTNDLPRTLADLSVASGFERCYCIAVAYPNFALEDHLAVGDAEELLKRRQFDFVVMQQGSSALPASRDNLVYFAGLFATLIRGNGAVPVMLSVWPMQSRMFDFPNVRDSYFAAATAIDGRFVPAGGAWLAAWERDNTLPLYAPDGLHPSPTGTYLAALVLLERLYGRSPVAVETQAHVNGAALGWPPATVRLLQEVAATANAREPE